MTVEQILFLALTDLLEALEDPNIKILGYVEPLEHAKAIARKAISIASGNAGDPL